MTELTEKQAELCTTNTTDFFREPEHFDLLEARLVPDLIALRRTERKPLLKIWSAASSTGAQVYTRAMVLADLVAQRQDLLERRLAEDEAGPLLHGAVQMVAHSRPSGRMRGRANQAKFNSRPEKERFIQ